MLEGIKAKAEVGGGHQKRACQNVRAAHLDAHAVSDTSHV